MIVHSLSHNGQKSRFFASSYVGKSVSYHCALPQGLYAYTIRKPCFSGLNACTHILTRNRGNQSGSFEALDKIHMESHIFQIVY